MIIRRASGAVGARVDGALIVLQPTMSEVVEFNEVAAAVWDALADQPADLDALAAAGVAEYDVDPNHGRDSINRFVQRAIDQGQARPSERAYGSSQHPTVAVGGRFGAPVLAMN